jgi:ABC-type multidrug transport system ATPase subunit
MPGTPQTDLAVQAQDIRKQFGNFTALNGITIDVRRGEFLALFGRNGAGKTTFLKIAATLMRASHGKLQIEGFDIDDQPERVRSKIGFLSHNTYVYRDLSPIENLRFFARLYGVSDAEQRIPALLERVGLRRRATDPVRSFSRGLQQRIGIARVLLHSPSLILLDEPYTGLAKCGSDFMKSR